MENTVTLELPTTTVLALSEHLRMSGSKLSTEQAAERLIGDWIAANSRPVEHAGGDGLHGYQWKEVFLPDGTDLRMIYAGGTYYARVTGEHLVYQGRRVSPRRFVMLVAGGVRNAWRDLWVRLPGRRDWQRALAVRTGQEKSHRIAPPSPADTINAAAACMSDALKTALTLVEQSNAQSVRKFERRIERHRRESDLLEDICKLD